MIRIMMVTEGYGEGLHGVEEVLLQLTRCCEEGGGEYMVCASHPVNIPERDAGRVKRVPVFRFTRMLRWHSRQIEFLQEQIRVFKPSVVHVHGCMTFVQRSAVLAARRASVPVLLSPHGMLEPWLWRQKGWLYYWFKRLYWKLFLMPALKQASYVHAITGKEAGNLETELPGLSQVCIPNAIALGAYPTEQQMEFTDKYFLFLGRLHPVKGVSLLIDAFAQLADKSFRLVIAGPDFDPAYAMQLREQVRSLNLTDRVEFTGEVQGERKARLYRGAWCSVTPSYSEVFALVNLESAASFTPAITTTGTGIQDWHEGGGMLIQQKLEELIAALGEAAMWSAAERVRCGARARNFVAERYSWDVVCSQWFDAYETVAGRL